MSRRKVLSWTLEKGCGFLLREQESGTESCGESYHSVQPAEYGGITAAFEPWNMERKTVCKFRRGRQRTSMAGSNKA
ncbi:hypothetical protein M5K25_006415 [Dendrobium thyrsiflorum]|uniref:Uncharacterized protein n=1 Tax=Dendrobium thyrsiflorum TaxID=117978 RepID=A0ABD0VBR1_DENTH